MATTNKVICKYIYKHWILPYRSQRSFAIDHNIEESIVRKIKNTALTDIDYSIPIVTLEKICEARNIKLSDFFTLLNL